MKHLFFLLIFALTTLSASAVAAKTTLINIKSSFYTDARKQGLSHNTINTIIKTLNWKINFNTLHINDQFIIVSSQKKKPDMIMFKRNRNNIKAFLWRGMYYDKNGKSLNNGFLKAPLKYKRISSTFQLRRYHPILKTYLPHRAIDYAANRGTPVYSTADGIVKFKGWKGALGKTVIIQHNRFYKTTYAHLSKYKRRLHRGKRVKKGQVIGYVGSTGRSTGPHLHYELHYKGKRRNPLTWQLSIQKSVAKSDLERFKNKVNTILRSF